jgi:MscS family membrane protein
MSRALAGVALTAALSLSLGVTAAEPTPSNAQGTCRTPQEAVYQLIYWLQPERWEPEQAALCVDTSGLDAPATEGPRRAELLKRVLDGRGLYVSWDDIPVDPAYENPETELARFVLFPLTFPELVVTKVGDRWLIAASTLEAAPALYDDTFAFELGHFIGDLPRWLRTPVLGVSLWQLVGLFLLIPLGLALQKLVVFLISVWLRRATRRVHRWWVGDIIVAAGKPLGGLAMAAVFSLGLPLLQLPVTLNKVALLAIRVLAAFSVVWLGWRLSDVITSAMSKRAATTETKLDDQLVPLVRRALQVLIFTLGTLFILQNLDVDVGSLLAGLGLGGLAFALAAKDTIANLFGSLTIFLDKPFQVGDWIKIGSDIEGTVEDVGFRSTRIRTFYSSVFTVPNATIANAAIDNLGVRHYRRYKTTLSLTYATPPEKIIAFCEGVRALIQALPGMRKDYDLVEFTEFGAHSLDVLLYCFMDTPDWPTELRTRNDLNLAILQLARDVGVDFAFPTQSLYLEQVAAPKELAPPRELDPAALASVGHRFGPGGADYGKLHLAGLAKPAARGNRRGDADG